MILKQYGFLKKKKSNKKLNFEIRSNSNNIIFLHGSHCTFKKFVTKQSFKWMMFLIDEEILKSGIINKNIL